MELKINYRRLLRDGMISEINPDAVVGKVPDDLLKSALELTMLSNASVYGAAKDKSDDGAVLNSLLDMALTILTAAKTHGISNEEFLKAYKDRMDKYGDYSNHLFLIDKGGKE